MPNKLRLVVGLTLLCWTSSLHAGTNQTNEVSFAARFDALVFPTVATEIRQAGTNLGGNIAWGPAYQMAALVEMLEATRDSKYAEQCVRLGDWVAAAQDNQNELRDEIRGGSFPAWSTTGYSEGKRYIWAVHTGTIAAPLARFAAVVRNDSALKQKWNQAADRQLQVAEAAVAVHDPEYRDGPQAGEGYVYCPYLKKPLPLNMQNALAQAWQAIDDARATTNHARRIRCLAQFTRNRLRSTDDGSYVWAYWPPLSGRDDSFEDISHAAANVNFMLRCYEHGVVFTRADVERLRTTLLRHVLQPGGRISDQVGGGKAVDTYRTAVLRWARLTRHIPELRSTFEEFAKRAEFANDTTSLPWTLAALQPKPSPSAP